MKMRLRILRFSVTMMLGISAEAGLDVEDLIARGFTCSLADTRFHLFKLTAEVSIFICSMTSVFIHLF